MNMDTIDAIGDVITRYTTAHDASKVGLHLTPQNNFSSYTEDDHHSTSAESTEDEGHDDYEIPISSPHSRRPSTHEMRESSGDISKLESSTSETDSPIIAPPEASSSRLPPSPRGYLSTSPPPAYEAGHDDISNLSFHIFKTSASAPMTEPASEVLPSYAANIEFANVFLRKSEFHTLSHRCPDRKWRRVIASLTGTKLEIHSATRPLLSHAMPSHNDETTNFRKGALMKSYSLQHAEFGLASDYLKRKHVIRVRVEADQFLLSCSRIETLVAWMEGLQWAAGMALDLDERAEVKEQTLPRNLRRRRRRREETTLAPVSRRGEPVEMPDEDEDSGAAGEDRLSGGPRTPETSRSPSPTIEEETAPDPEQSSSHGVLLNNHLFPTWAHSSIASTPNISRASSVRRPPVPPTRDAIPPIDGSHSRSASNMTIAFRPALRQALSPERPRTSCGNQNGRNGLARYPSALSQSTMNLAPPSGPPSMVNTPNTSSLNLSLRRARRKAAKSTSTLPSIEKEVWNPTVRWSSTYDLAYAKKCMPVMHRFARRKSTYIIFQGERFLVCASKAKDTEGRAIATMVKLERSLPEMTAKEGEPPIYVK